MLNRKDNADVLQTSDIIEDAKKEEKSSKKKKPFLLKIVAIVEGFLIFIMLLFSIMTIGTNLQPSKDGVSRIPLTDSALFTVRTDSMNPTFKKGDMIYGKIVDIKKFDFSKIVATKSIITFKYVVQDDNGKAVSIFNTHRVIEVIKTGTRYTYITKGDKEGITATETVKDSEVVALYHGKIPVIGNIVNTLQQSQPLFFCVIVLPLILLFIANAFYFIRIFYVSGKEQAVENAIVIKEEEKAKILEEARKQVLDELAKEQDKKNNE